MYLFFHWQRFLSACVTVLKFSQCLILLGEKEIPASLWRKYEFKLNGTLFENAIKDLPFPLCCLFFKDFKRQRLLRYFFLNNLFSSA